MAGVAAPVLHLRPAGFGRIEPTTRDADDPVDAVVRLEQWDEAGPERAGRPVTATFRFRSASCMVHLLSVDDARSPRPVHWMLARLALAGKGATARTRRQRARCLGPVFRP